MCMLNPVWQLRGLLICRNDAGLELLGFSWVHKCVLRHSCETLASIGSELRHIVDEVDSFGRTPLYWAAAYGDSQQVHDLLLNGASPDLTDFNRTTPLHIASSIAAIDCMKSLLTAGAKIEAKDRMGFTPLGYASTQGY